MKISELPKATSVNDVDVLPIVQDGETKQVPKDVLVPPLEVDTAMSDDSDNPVQNKAVKAYVDEKAEQIPTDLRLTGNRLYLDANGDEVGDGIVLPEPTTPDDLRINGTHLQLTAKGKPVGEGVEIQTAESVAEAIEEATKNGVDGIVITDSDGNTKYLGKFRISSGHPALEITKIGG